VLVHKRSVIKAYLTSLPIANGRVCSLLSSSGNGDPSAIVVMLNPHGRPESIWRLSSTMTLSGLLNGPRYIQAWLDFKGEGE
jgi:hypothetical protein